MLKIFAFLFHKDNVFTRYQRVSFLSNLSQVWEESPNRKRLIYNDF